MNQKSKEKEGKTPKTQGLGQNVDNINIIRDEIKKIKKCILVWEKGEGNAN